jgi:hypothetical protein
MNDNVAAVACKQMGYSGGRVLERAITPNGSNQIWLDQVTCTGSETSIYSCNHAGWGTVDSSCNDHTHDVGIGCDPGNSTTQNAAYPGIRFVTTAGSILNSYGNFATHGRVEVRKNGIWGTVCNDNLDNFN